MPKKIIIAGFAVAVIGLLLEFVFTLNYDVPTYYYYLHEYLAAFNLSFSKAFRVSGDVNYLNVFLYSLLLLGSILYAISRKESRLLRYVFSVVFFYKFFLTLISLIALPFMLGRLLHFKPLMITLAGYTVLFLWLLLCYKILRYFKYNTPVAFNTYEYADGEKQIIIEANGWQRFFNLIADAVSFTLVLLPFISLLGEIEFIRKLAMTGNSEFMARAIVYVVGSIIMIIFYMVFERVFQATPGKLLTGTRVVTDTGESPTVRNIFVRTLSRMVPFEGFSALGGRPWHDEWSDTYVVDEGNKGVRGGFYFLIFPIGLLLGLVGYIGYEMYKTHRSETLQKEAFEADHNRMVSMFNKLTPNHIIVFETGYDRKTFFKTEKVTPQGITFTIIPGGDKYRYDNYQMDMEEFYNAEKDSLEQVTLTPKQLESALPKRYDERSYSNDRGTELIKNKATRYTVLDVQEWFGPTLKMGSLSFTRWSQESKTLSLEIKNEGWTTDLIKLEDKTGLVWEPSLPQTIKAAKGYSRGITLYTSGSGIEEVDMVLTFKDTLNRIQVFELKADDEKEFHRAELKRIK